MRTPEQALALMAVCQATGQHPAMACVQFHVIQNKPVMTSQAMQARFQQAGGKLKWIQRTDEVAEAEFSHPSGGTLKVKWGMADARRIGLANRDNWKNYPRQMLSARVISEGVRSILPGVILGFCAPEEVVDVVVEAPAPDSASEHRPLFGAAPTPAPATTTDATPALAGPDAIPLETPAVDLAALETIIGGAADAANELLRAKGWLPPDGTWRQLAPDRAAFILENAGRFRRAIAAAKQGGAQ